MIIRALYLLILLGFGSNRSFSQHIIVDYKTIPNGQYIEKSDGSESSSSKTLINEAFELVALMTSQLKASQTESIFLGTTQMNSDVDELNFKLAKLFVDNDSEYKCDLMNNSTSRWCTVFGKKFIINSKISDFDWKLTKEKKQIGEYNCYKAICSYEVINTSGTFRKNVEAWYTTDIPYRFGPKGYCGLPGLILELTDNKISYVVNNISFKKETFIVGALPKGELITQKKLDSLANKASEDRRSKFKKKE